MKKFGWLFLVLALGLGAGVFWWRAQPVPTELAAATAPTAPTAAPGFVMPELTGVLVIGQRGFGANCAACHGDTLGGVDAKGPPLLHNYYVPGHHGDAALASAMRNGAPAHHWNFGDMPPVAGLTEADIGAIIAYIRTVQKANGIF